MLLFILSYSFIIYEKYMFDDISCYAHVNNFKNKYNSLELFIYLFFVKSWLLRLSAPGNISVLGLCLLIVILLSSLCLVYPQELSVLISSHPHATWYPSGSDNCLKSTIATEVIETVAT